ncbi:branched-chain amino acid ABC transporter permease [Devosia sp. FJ2-5-3]|uniref:branched-chain amino acid ABC transporter permease n=1 Tax=Devosia sp. FJ2-5-3 TaxID=2976680 RepID=UPI0023D8184B|nr:branched-chain amino acid ABC transporter permease [Devosia sp. FJ2-5-3]WEJ60453.1 branched-chain amino acid ABC transporter permease [Devosia sp. FJ2-5-3]
MSDTTNSLSPGKSASNGNTRLLFGLVIALIALLAVAPFFVYPLFLMKVMCFALFACSLNLLLGFGGLLSFGHAAFFGMASYVTGYTAKAWGFTPELAILAGVVVAALMGLLFGLLAIRRHGIYFSMITLAFAQMVFFFALQAPFTGGEDGLQAIPRGQMFGFIDLASDMTLYWVVLVIFLAGFLAVYRIVNSPFGEVLAAIRGNEARATSLGYDVVHHKVMLFVLSATLAGLAGGTKAIVFQLATLTDVNWTMSSEVILMTLVGGMGTFFGPIVGAALVVSMQNYLSHLGSWVLVVQGAIFVLCVLVFRAGIVGVLSRWLKRPL